MIKTAVPQAQVYLASEMPKWIFWFNNRDMNKALDLAEISEVDYIVVSGMTMCDEFVKVQGPVLKKMSARGVKVIFSGCGGAVYSKGEIANFRALLKSINVAGFIARDKESYENYKDLFPVSYCGIDCAFFLGDFFQKLPLSIKDFVVYNFDRVSEPVIDQPNKNIIRTHHSCTEVLAPPGINRTYLFALLPRWPFIERVRFNNPRTRFLSQDNTMISDMPEDYLHLYANVSAVYTERVHACISTLSFGNAARLYSKSPRTYLFDRLGASAIHERLIKLDMEMLKKEKQKQLSALTDIFKQSNQPRN
jgi:hypothetical protein